MVELEADRARSLYGPRSLSVKTFITLLEVIDLFIFMAAGVVAGWLRFGIANFVGPRELVVILAVFICLFAFRLFKLHDPAIFANPYTQMQRAILAVLFVCVIAVTAGYLTRTSAEFSRLWVAFWLIGSLGTLVFTRPLVSLVYRKMESTGSFSRNFVIFGRADQLDYLKRFLDQWTESAHASDQILGVFLDEPKAAELADFVNADMITGSIDNFVAWGKNHKVDRAIIALPANEYSCAQPMLEKLRPISLNVELTIGELDPRWLGRHIDTISGVPTVRVLTSPLNGNQITVKRAEDLACAIAAILFLWPLMLLVAILIKLDSPGPIIFRQLRHGFNNKTFEVLKFRTMLPESAESIKLVQATRNDPRITRIGNFLRKTSIDELPQLFNVLRGDMSIVGPRPHPIQLDDLYAAEIYSYLARQRIKPGITGWAQVNGYRGETDRLEKMQKRVDYDLFYVDNWSFSLDLKIILMTLGCLVHPNAY